MKLIDFYYYNLGEEPNKAEKEITEKTFNHLKDNGYSDKDIINMIPYFPAKMALSHEDLPDCLWDNSLIERDIFYYHSELHITSPAPYWDFENDKIVSPKFFLEIKIHYTIDDLIKYYYKKFPIDLALLDNKKDKGSMEYLLKKYNDIDFISPVDFVLFLIDEASSQTEDIVEIIELKKYEKETFKYLKHKTINAKAENLNKITWR